MRLETDEQRLDRVDADVRAAICATPQEWRDMGWRLREWYRWLIRSPVPVAVDPTTSEE